MMTEILSVENFEDANCARLEAMLWTDERNACASNCDMHKISPQ